MGNRTVILSFGGSLGARRINEVVADLAAWEKDFPDKILHIHATGSRGVELFDTLAKEKGFAGCENIRAQEYIEDMPRMLAAADLVISRAGALTLAELECMGRASVLIPSPNVAENHQYHNAMELKKVNAAVVLEEKNLTGQALVDTVRISISPGQAGRDGNGGQRPVPAGQLGANLGGIKGFVEQKRNLDTLSRMFHGVGKSPCSEPSGRKKP